MTRHDQQYDSQNRGRDRESINRILRDYLLRISIHQGFSNLSVSVNELMDAGRDVAIESC